MSSVQSTRKKAKRLTKAIFQAMVEKARDGIFIYQDHTFFYVNPAFERIAGYSADALETMGLKDIVRSDMARLVEQRYENSRGEEALPGRFEVVVLTADGQERILSLNPSFITINETRATLNIARDITSRIRSQDGLESTNQFLTSLIESSSDAIVATDIHGMVLIFNQAAQSITGYKAEELMHHSISIQEFMGQGEQERIYSLLNQGKAESPARIVGEETTLYTREGELVPISLSASLVYQGDNPVATINVFRDLRPIRVVQGKLKESEQKYRMLVEKANDGIFVYQDHLFKYTNPKFSELLGYTRKELAGMGLRDIVKPGLAHVIEDRYDRRIRGEKVPNHYEITFVDKKGVSKDFEITPAVIEYEGRVATQNIFRDITERKLAEMALRESEARYRTSVERTGTAMMIFGPDYIINLINNQMERFSGYTKDEMLGKMRWIDIVHEEDVERMVNYQRARRSGAINVPWEYEFRSVDKYGNIKDAYITIGLIPETDECILSIMDITERKRLELELDQSRKMVVLGEMSAHVAHEVRNPLQKIKTGIELLSRSAQFNKRQKKILDGVANGMDNLEHFVTQILDWSRSGKVNLKEYSLSNIIDGLIFNFEEHFLAGNIKTQTIYDTKADRIVADGIQLRQALEDIIDNAIDAMPKGGTLLVTTAYVRDYTFRGKNMPFVSDAVKIRIKDTGEGIAGEDLGKVFQPFFTSKAKGTGLGLALVQKVIDVHKGEVEVISEAGKGSEFILILPLSGTDK
ncbi:MAG: PAS domain S-box protein [Deltaproteobacteria bacterium]|nr:PAS domain S-box protein [Deltaproteobacteria bacterium]